MTLRHWLAFGLILGRVGISFANDFRETKAVETGPADLLQGRFELLSSISAHKSIPACAESAERLAARFDQIWGPGAWNAIPTRIEELERAKEIGSQIIVAEIGLNQFKPGKSPRTYASFTDVLKAQAEAGLAQGKGGPLADEAIQDSLDRARARSEKSAVRGSTAGKLSGGGSLSDINQPWFLEFLHAQDFLFNESIAKSDDGDFIVDKALYKSYADRFAEVVAKYQPIPPEEAKRLGAFFNEMPKETSHALESCLGAAARAGRPPDVAASAERAKAAFLAAGNSSCYFPKERALSPFFKELNKLLPERRRCSGPGPCIDELGAAYAMDQVVVDDLLGPQMENGLLDWPSTAPQFEGAVASQKRLNEFAQRASGERKLWENVLAQKDFKELEACLAKQGLAPAVSKGRPADLGNCPLPASPEKEVSTKLGPMTNLSDLARVLNTAGSGSADYARAISQWPDEVPVWDYLASRDAKVNFVHFVAKMDNTDYMPYEKADNLCTTFGTQFFLRYGQHQIPSNDLDLLARERGLIAGRRLAKYRMPVYIGNNGPHIFNLIELDPNAKTQNERWLVFEPILDAVHDLTRAPRDPNLDSYVEFGAKVQTLDRFDGQSLNFTNTGKTVYTDQGGNLVTPSERLAEFAKLMTYGEFNIETQGYKSRVRQASRHPKLSDQELLEAGGLLIGKKYKEPVPGMVPTPAHPYPSITLTADHYLELIGRPDLEDELEGYLSQKR